jgi:hypothetical protein
MNFNIINRASAAAIGLIIASVIFAFITVGIKLALPAPAIDADRAAERSKALAEIRTAEEKALATPGWIDQPRGIVRVPIETAMQQAVQAWQNPAAARADLAARAEKAAAELPKAPEKPSAFE